MKSEHGPENVFDFSLGNPHLEPPSDVLERLKDLVDDRTPGLHRYMTTAGIPEVRAQVASHVSRREGVALSANQILMTCGAAGAINVAMRALVQPAEEVILFAPCFAEYRFYCLHVGAQPIVIPPQPDFDLDAEALARAITPQTRMVIINSPNNPTGRVYSSATIQRLGEVLNTCNQKRNRPIVLLADDPYRKIVYDGVKVPALFPHYRTSMIATSFSKDLGLAGERIGYLAMHPDFPDANEVLEGLCFCLRTLGFVNAPALMQRLVAESLDSTVDVTDYRVNRDLLCHGLRRGGYNVRTPEGAFFAFPEAPGGDDLQFLEHLLAERILPVPGVGFEAPGYFRLSYSVERSVIERSLPGFDRALRNAHAHRNPLG
jgi:aspartate aminotransferase